MTDVIYRGYTIEKAFEKVKNNPDVVRRRITNFLRDGHHSVFEFAGASWLIEGSRAFTHEIIRHRIASYWQESQRYVDYSKGHQTRQPGKNRVFKAWVDYLNGEWAIELPITEDNIELIGLVNG